MGKETLDIKVVVDSSEYPLTIKRDQEESIRKGAANVNKALLASRHNYLLPQPEDHLKLLALRLSTELVRREMEEGASAEEEELEKLNRRLEEYLASIEKR